MKKRYLLLIILLICLFNLNVNASTNTTPRTEQNPLLPDWVDKSNLDLNAVLATPAVDSSEKIYDFAELLSDGEEVKLYSYAKEYVSHTEYDIVLLSSSDLGGKDPYTYMYNFYDYNSFERNGIILLAYKNGDNIDIYMGTTSYGSDSKVTDIYTQAYIKAIVNYLNDLFESDNYYQGFNDFIKLGIGVYDKQTDNSGNLKFDENGNLVDSINYLDIVVIALAITMIVTILLIYLYSNKKKKVIPVDYLNKNTLVINKTSDVPINGVSTDTDNVNNIENNNSNSNLDNNINKNV